MNKLARRPRLAAAPKRAAAARRLSLALSMTLVFQTFASLSPASAQRKPTTPPPPKLSRTGGTTAAPAQGGGKAIKPKQRPVTALEPVYMKLLESQHALGPQRYAPRQLKPIHRPKPVASRKIAPVKIPSAAKRAAARAALLPAAPVSTGVQSPPPTRAFRSDFISIGVVPPDTMGAVGPSHVVTTTNEKIIIHDRMGVVLSVMALDTFWASVLLGGNPPNAFDPKVLYDRFNDRFIIVSQANSVSPTSATLVAVSQTGDPTAGWNRIAIDADAAATASSGRWADYPSIGFNKNWIAVQVNLFNYSGPITTASFGPAVYVIDKGAFYNNTLSLVSTFEASLSTCLASATQEAELGCGFTMVPATTEDNTTETEYIVEQWSSTNGQLRVSKITGTPASPVLTVGTQFPQSPNSWEVFASNIGGTGYVPQRAFESISAGVSPFRIAANDSRIQGAVFRNGSLWAVHHVMLPTVPTAAGVPASTPANPDNHVAVQWWEIDPTVEPLPPLDTTTGLGTTPTQRGRIEDPTSDNCHNGGGGLRPACVVQGQNFSFPSIAVNANDAVLIGYSRFSETTLPKAAYSFRAGADAANTMRDSQTYREGLTDYGLTSPERWGDYSATVVDPTNDTDFWTIQEVSEGLAELQGPGNGFFSMWGTWWAQVKPSSTTTTAGNLIITEFRLRGPGLLDDEFVELYNPSNSPLTVTTTDGSDGWALVHSTASAAPTITVLAAIPNGTTIPARGHYLIVNHTHDLSSPLKGYPNTQPPGTPAAQVVRPSDADAAYFVDLETVGGIAIFRTSNPANFATTRMDSVGFQSLCTANPASIYKENTCIPDINNTGVTGEFSFTRVTAGASLTSPGAPQDTQDNAADFMFISTNHTETFGSRTPPRLGAPGLQNLSSPVVQPLIGVDRLSQTAPIGSSPNRVRKTCALGAEECISTRSNLGTLSLRRRVTNYTGAPVSRLRWRISLATTAPAPSTVGTADLRAISSMDITVNGQPVKGTTLEEPPDQTTRGGGWNASWSAELPTPLAPGAAFNVQFLFGVQQTGTFSVLIQTEALP